MAKTRVHDLAKEYGMTSKEMLDHLRDMKIPAKSASSTLEDAYVSIVRKKLKPILEDRAAQIEAAKKAEEEAAAEAKKAEEERARREAVEQERAAREAERARREAAEAGADDGDIVTRGHGRRVSLRPGSAGMAMVSAAISMRSCRCPSAGP